MKYRLHDWFNTDKLTPHYGIQVLIKGKWHHCMDNNGPLIFESKAQAQQKLKQLKEGKNV